MNGNRWFAGLARLLVVAHPRTLTFYRRGGFVEQGPAATRFGPSLRLARDLEPSIEIASS